MPSTDYEPRKKVWLVTAAVVLAVLIALYFIVPSLYRNVADSASDNTNLTTELEKQAEEIRLQLPKKMNESVTAFGIGVKGNTIMYDMRLAPEVDESQLSNQSLKDPMVGALCLNQDSRALLDAGAIYVYDYTHTGSGSVYKVAITQYDC